MARDDPSTASPHHYARAGARFVYHRWFRAENAGKFQRVTVQMPVLCIYGHRAGLMDCLNTQGILDFLKAMAQDDGPIHFTEAAEWYFANILPTAEPDELFAQAQGEATAFVCERAGMPANFALAC